MEGGRGEKVVEREVRVGIYASLRLQTSCVCGRLMPKFIPFVVITYATRMRMHSAN